MHSGMRGTFDDVFSDPAAARRVIAPLAVARLRATVKCVRDLPPSYARGLRVKAANYRQFALLPGGLTFGFSGTQTLCGRQVAVVPYAKVQALLTPLGRRLVAGVTAAGR